jgi:hypothetical protein
MKTLHSLKLAAVVALLIPAASRAQSAAASAAAMKADTVRYDLVGKWQFTVQSDVGSGTPMVTFATQKGDSIWGKYSSQALGEHDFAGTYKAGKINFGFSAEAGGQAFSMTFSGKLDDKDSMSGTLDLAGMATGTFGGKRVKP